MTKYPKFAKRVLLSNVQKQIIRDSIKRRFTSIKEPKDLYINEDYKPTNQEPLITPNQTPNLTQLDTLQ